VRSSQFAVGATRLDVIGLERVIESWAVTADVADGSHCSDYGGAFTVVA
jgi:hypothetical protein